MYDQSTLDTVSVVRDIGANAGVFSGLLYIHMLLPIIAEDGGAGGLGWCLLLGQFSASPVPMMYLFLFLAAQSQTFFNTANVVSAVKNFADYGGVAVGIMKGFLSLSGAILIQLYETMCAGDPASFNLLLAVAPTLLSLLVMTLVRIYESSTAGDKKHLNGFSAVSLIIATYLHSEEHLWPAFIGQCCHACMSTRSACLTPTYCEKSTSRPHEKTVLPDKSPLIISPKATTSLNRSSEGDSQIEAGLSENLNLLQAMKNLSFWLLFLSMICGMGSGSGRWTR